MKMMNVCHKKETSSCTLKHEIINMDLILKNFFHGKSIRVEEYSMKKFYSCIIFNHLPTPSTLSHSKSLKQELLAQIQQHIFKLQFKTALLNFTKNKEVLVLVNINRFNVH